jgi:integrase
MMAKRKYGVGRIEQRGPNRFRLRYSIGGQKYTRTVAGGSKAEAQQQLRALLHAGDKGMHIDPSKLTVGEWTGRWLELIGRNPAGGKRRRGLVNPRTAERYGQLLQHVKAKLGNVALQKLTGTMIDELYLSLEQKLAVRTVLHVHNALRPCLASAVKKKLLVSNPADDAETPVPGHRNVATALGEEELQCLVKGFRGHPLEWIVDLAACTGARRNEILALQWRDIDFDAKTLTISRSVEETKEYGRHTKEPKTERGRRTIAIDDALVERLRGYRNQMKRLVAGVPDHADVDLGLIKIPDSGLLFPGDDLTDLNRLRDAPAVTRTFQRHARRVGFKLRFHDLRASHLTILLDKGEPVHVVAHRAGHDPVTLLRNYAKWSKKADAKVADTLASLSKGMA